MNHIQLKRAGTLEAAVKNHEQPAAIKRVAAATGCGAQPLPHCLGTLDQGIDVRQLSLGQGAKLAVTFQSDPHFGRILAAYGGVFVAGSLVWGVAFDGFRPDRWDLAGAAICLVGVAVIMAPRGS